MNENADVTIICHNNGIYGLRIILEIFFTLT